MIFMDRERRASRYPWLEWKVRLFAIGAALALGGMILLVDWLVTVGIGVLTVGFVIRFLPGGRGEREAEEGELEDRETEEIQGDE
jgi:hypothetical protein